jgi:hypothetical protein
VSSCLQTVNGGNNYSLKEYYRTVFEGNHHDRFICPTLDYFKFSRYVDYLTSQFGKSNCFIAPYEHFMSHNESVISELLLFLGVNFEYSPSSNKQNQQKGLIYTFLLRLENYFLARRISSNPSLFTGIPVYNFRKKKKSYLTLKNILTFLLKKGLFLDTKYKDRTDTSKRILELCKDDNRQLDEIHSLGIASYGYYCTITTVKKFGHELGTSPPMLKDKEFSHRTFFRTFFKTFSRSIFSSASNPAVIVSSP